MRWHALKIYLRTYNAFPERDSSDVDEHCIRTQIIATRIYIFLLCASLFALILTRSLAFDTRRLVVIQSPSLQQFKAVEDIRCSCSTTQRNEFFYVFTTFVSFYGGLTVVLRIIIPRVVIWFRRQRRRTAWCGND